MEARLLQLPAKVEPMRHTNTLVPSFLDTVVERLEGLLRNVRLRSQEIKEYLMDYLKVVAFCPLTFTRSSRAERRTEME